MSWGFQAALGRADTVDQSELDVSIPSRDSSESADTVEWFPDLKS
jgi:hypothetical protein